jgi:hypothetical protein
MTALLRAGATLVAVVLLAAVGLAGLALAVFSIPAGDDGLPRLLGWLALPDARDEAGRFLASVEADGPVAVAGALSAGGVLVVALLVAAGLLLGREREIAVRGEGADHLGARRRALRGAAAARARRVGGLTGLRVRVGPRRLRRRPTVRVTLRHDGSGRAQAPVAAVRAALDDVASAFGLRVRVRARRARGRSRRRGAARPRRAVTPPRDPAADAPVPPAPAPPAEPGPCGSARGWTAPRPRAAPWRAPSRCCSPSRSPGSPRWRCCWR